MLLDAKLTAASVNQAGLANSLFNNTLSLSLSLALIPHSQAHTLSLART